MLSVDGLTLLSGGASVRLFSFSAPSALINDLYIDNFLDDDAIVIVWNLTTGEATQKISSVYHGAISATIWISINDSSEPAFVFGCADGSIHLYMRKSAHVSYLMAININVTMKSLTCSLFCCRQSMNSSRWWHAITAPWSHLPSTRCIADWPVLVAAFLESGKFPPQVCCSLLFFTKKIVHSCLGTMTPVSKSEEPRPLVARSVFFCDEGASLVVGYLESHEL